MSVPQHHSDAEQSQPPQAPPMYGPPPVGTPYSQAPDAQAPLPVPPPERRGLGTGAIVGIIAGGVVLLLMIGLVAGLFAAFRTVVDTPERRPVADLAGAGEAVENYLHALADGDATAARQFVRVNDGEDLLLTDEVLAASLRLAPITDIEVEAVAPGFEGNGASVRVSFMVGDERVEREFQAWESSPGWELSDGTLLLTFDAYEELGPKINGVPVEGLLQVFPGIYEFALTSEHLEPDLPESRVRLADEGDSTRFYGVEIVPTDAGAQLFRSSVRASLEECLAMTTFVTPCGLDVQETTTGVVGDRIVEGTVRRELTEEGRQRLETLSIEVEFEADSRTAASSWDYIPVSITGELPSGERVIVSSTPMRVPRIDFADAEPRVEWLDPGY